MTFRERYQKWKAGEQVYSAGKILPHFKDGDDVKSKSKSNWGLNHFAYNPTQSIDNLFYRAGGKDLHMPRYEEGKDDKDTSSQLTQEDIDFSKNWLINQLTNRKGTFVDTSYEDDIAGNYDYARDFDKQYSDYLSNQTIKDWLNSKKNH